jgi:hypothetical protein
MDMSACDPAGTGGLGPGGLCLPLPGCSNANLVGCTAPTTFLNNKGLLVQTVAGVVTMNPAGVPPTGAAYVVISPGESGGGGYLNSGQQFAGITADGTEEQKNYANLALRAPALYYVDDSISDKPGAATHFDDVVSRPSVLSVITKAGLGPRSH